jgi:hypothetical protein
MRGFVSILAVWLCFVGLPIVLLTGIASPFVWTSTRYGPGYSESRFKSIRVGAPDREVRSALGAPLAEFTNTAGQLTLIYSFQDSKGLSMYFRHRTILLSNDVVVGKMSFIDYD